MPDLHGLQTKEEVAMSSPVVLITGALTSIGRATALAFANEGARVVVSGRHDDEGQKLATGFANSALKPNLCAPTCVWLELDDAKTIHLKRGDVVVQNGTRHAWRNKGTAPVTMLFFLNGAKE
jgi:NAD(P)-dependent dehydrogenase (short-subunit alcohol dehydrogenase family)